MKALKNQNLYGAIYTSTSGNSILVGTAKVLKTATWHVLSDQYDVENKRTNLNKVKLMFSECHSSPKYTKRQCNIVSSFHVSNNIIII